jgi:hypothetical protein
MGDCKILCRIHEFLKGSELTPKAIIDDSFQEEINHVGDKTDLEVTELDNHLILIVGLASMADIPADIRECVEEYFLEKNGIQGNFLTYCIVNKILCARRNIEITGQDPEDIMGKYIAVRATLVREFSLRRVRLQEAINRCIPSSSSS